MKLIVYRDKDGKIQNIGDWDYMVSVDADGNKVINNPLPPDYTSKIEEVTINDDGSRTVE